MKLRLPVLAVLTGCASIVAGVLLLAGVAGALLTAGVELVVAGLLVDVG